METVIDNVMFFILGMGLSCLILAAEWRKAAKASRMAVIDYVNASAMYGEAADLVSSWRKTIGEKIENVDSDVEHWKGLYLSANADVGRLNSRCIELGRDLRELEAKHSSLLAVKDGRQALLDKMIATNAELEKDIAALTKSRGECSKTNVALIDRVHDLQEKNLAMQKQHAANAVKFMENPLDNSDGRKLYEVYYNGNLLGGVSGVDYDDAVARTAVMYGVGTGVCELREIVDEWQKPSPYANSGIKANATLINFPIVLGKQYAEFVIDADIGLGVEINERFVILRVKS